MQGVERAHYYEEILENAKQIARELVSYGAEVVILSGSAAKGKRNPQDLDLMVWGKLQIGKRTLEEILSPKVGRRIDVAIFSEEYIESLIKEYKENEDNYKNSLGTALTITWQQGAARVRSWPLVPLLSEQEFQDLFGHLYRHNEYENNGQPYIVGIQREYIILVGEEKIGAKKKTLQNPSQTSPSKMEARRARE